jgi:hypothetical protein
MGLFQPHNSYSQFLRNRTAGSFLYEAPGVAAQKENFPQMGRDRAPRFSEEIPSARFKISKSYVQNTSVLFFCCGDISSVLRRKRCLRSSTYGDDCRIGWPNCQFAAPTCRHLSVRWDLMNRGQLGATGVRSGKMLAGSIDSRCGREHRRLEWCSSRAESIRGFEGRSWIE